jgi:hypothetical protein
MAQLQKNRTGFWLLKISGNYWPKKDLLQCTTEELLAKFMYFFTFAALITVVIVYITTVCTSDIDSTFTVLGMITIAVDALSVIPAQLINQKRLLQPARVQDASVIEESSRIALLYFRLFVLSSSLFVLFFCLLNPVNGFSGVLIVVLFIGECALASYLSFNLMMLLMDLKVSSLLIDQLFLLADCKALSMDKFNLVRNDIHRRVNVSKWASDFIVVPCLCSTVVIAVICQSKDPRAYNVALLLIKEILFVGVAFWYVAKLNERADALTRKLCAAIWHVDTENGSVTVTDTERLSICATCMAEPISFTLLFKRLSLQNVAVSFAGFAASVMAGLIKHAIGV